MKALQLLVVSIEELSIVTKSGNAKVSGKPYTINEQIGYVRLIGTDGQPEKYPTKVSINVENDEKGAPVPYPLGQYTLDASSFMVGDFNALRLGRIKLVKLEAETLKKAA